MKKYLTRLTTLCMAVIMLLTLFGCKKIDEPIKEEDTTKPAPVFDANPLTGDASLADSAKGKRPVAVVVENSPAARPQWGLGSADITIEGLVEGGITRMLWVYADVATIPKVGPTRSARIDFVEMAEGLDAVFTHFGGAASAYDAIHARKTDDIDGNGQGNYRGTAQYFKRDSSRNGRGTEHTAYTNGEWLTNALGATGIRTEIKSGYETPFSFNDKAAKLSGGDCKELKITFSSSYKHTFNYNADDNLYYNVMNTTKMVDENGKQMAVTNVIILYFPSYASIPNTKGSIDMDLSGGKGIVVSNGTYEEITWKKGGPTDMLKLYNAKGEEFKLNKGKSYLGLIPQANSNSTSIS